MLSDRMNFLPDRMDFCQTCLTFIGKTGECLLLLELFVKVNMTFVNDYMKFIVNGNTKFTVNHEAEGLFRNL